MSAHLWVVALGNLALAGYILARTAGPLSALWRLARMPTTPVARIAPGPVEVSGHLRSEGTPALSFDGSPCVVVFTEITSKVGGESHHERKVHAASPARLSDGSGECLISLDEAIVVSRRRAVHGKGDEMRSRYPSLATFMKPGADRVSITEYSIEEGALALVSAEAVEEVERPGDGGDFRSDAGSSLLLRGSASRQILVARGRQWAILWEVGAPALWLALLAGVFVFQAAVVLWRAALP